MAIPPPPYANIAGTSQVVAKYNEKESISEADGNARPGQLIIDLETDPPQLYIGNNAGNLSLVSSGNTQISNYLAAGLVGNIIPSGNAVHNLGNATNQWNDLYVSNSTIFMNNVPITLSEYNVLTVDGSPVTSITPPLVYNTTQDAYYNTISDAIIAASNNDIIEIAAGVYQEQLYVDKPLTLRGPNYQKIGTDPTRTEEAIIQYYPALGNNNSTFYTDVDGVTIEGLTFDCPDSLLTATPTPVTYPISVFFYAVNNFTFRNNRMYGGYLPFYIYFANTAKSGLLIEGNYIDCGPWVNDRYNRGMYLYGCSGTVQNNVIENSNIGIQFSVNPNNPLSSPSTITGNKISAALHGLYNNVMPKGTAQHNWTLNTVTVAPNDRLGLKKLVGQPGAPWGPYETTHFSAARFQYIGTDGASSTPPTVSMTNNLFVLARDPNKVYNNLNWVGASFVAGSTGGGIAPTAVLNITNNSITGWTIGARNQGGANANMSNNWWGTATQGNVVIENTSTGSVTIAPISTNGVAGLPSTASFLP